MKRVVLFLFVIGFYLNAVDAAFGQTVIRDSVTIFPPPGKPGMNVIQSHTDCTTPTTTLPTFILPGTVTITVLPAEFSFPNLVLGPLYISSSRFIGQGDSIGVFSGIVEGSVWSMEFPQARPAIIWLVFGPSGSPDSGPQNQFKRVNLDPFQFDFFMCGIPPGEPSHTENLRKFANFNFRYIPFPVDHFAAAFDATTIAPGEHTRFRVWGMDRYDNQVNGWVADTTFADVSLDANSARYGGLTLNDPNDTTLDSTTYAELENVPSGSFVYFVANGEEPDVDQIITITMTKTNDAGVSGTGTLTITGATELDHFEVTLQPDTIAQGETATITVLAKDADNNTISLSAATPLNFSLDANGESLGHLIAPNGTQAKSLAGIAYGDAAFGNVKYIANDESPASTQTVTVAVVHSDFADKTGGGVVAVEPGLDHFAVTVAPDTIAHNDTATVVVQAKDQDDNDVIIPEDTLLKFALNANGELLGNFIAPNGSQA